MKRGTTISQNVNFLYHDKIQIVYGHNYELENFSLEKLRELLVYFRGQTILIGASRDNRPIGSLGAWLQENVTQTAIASYVAAILVEQGFATTVDEHNIRII